MKQEHLKLLYFEVWKKDTETGKEEIKAAFRDRGLAEDFIRVLNTTSAKSGWYYCIKRIPGEGGI